jgi:hypothetical protein
VAEREDSSMWRVVAVGGFLLMTLMVGRAQATLFDRGNGLVYGDFDNLSWTAVGNGLPGIEVGTMVAGSRIGAG